jgi:putative ABC transport system permease protein
MFRNHLKIAWRNLWKGRLYSVINITGLATGLCVCMLIMTYALHEWSFDRFHQHAGRVYMAGGSFKLGASQVQMLCMSYATAPAVQQQHKGVEASLRTFESQHAISIQNVAAPDAAFSEKNILYADSNYFRFFSFRLLEGSPDQVLKRPMTVVLSAAAAKKYFGNASPLGKMLRFDHQYDLEVTGVAADAPSNSSIAPEFVISLPSLKQMDWADKMMAGQRVASGSFKTYFLLTGADQVPGVQRAISRLAEANESEHYFLSPFTDYHTRYQNFDNVRYLKFVPWVAGLILLLALINYMSLATARATIRAAEIGVRKVMGAGRHQIAKQFYIESTLYAVLSFIAGWLLFRCTQPYFYNMLSLKVDGSFLATPLVTAVSAALLLITVIGSGSYPAFVLSSFNPVKVLTGKAGAGGARVRRVFTILQFTMAVALIICSIVIDRQLHYFRHKNTGMNRENVLMVPFGKTAGRHFQPWRQEVQALPGVQQVAAANRPMYKEYNVLFTKAADSTDITLRTYNIDRQFISLLGVQWKLPPQDMSWLERGGVAINETALKKMVLPADPRGKKLNIPGETEIAGVLKDFNYASLADEIGALSLFVMADSSSLWGEAGGCLYIKTAPGTNIPSLLAAVKKTYQRYDREASFQYYFMDEAFDALYRAEERLARMFGLFTLLTALIACLGLFGLAAFMAERRTREIGIRKVLGASVAGIVKLLSTDFLKPVLIAVVIASGLAWYMMREWLDYFAYRISLQWWMFALAGAAAILIAVLTVSYQSVRAALANPVRSLKTE